MINRNSISLILACTGVAIGAISALQTFSHVQDPTYRVPLLQVEEGSSKPLTETHSNYHAFREFLLAVGVLGIFLWMSLTRGFIYNQQLWMVGLTLVAAYTLGWWLPWPLFDLRAPGPDAVTAHLVATLCLVVSILLQKPQTKDYRAI